MSNPCGNCLIRGTPVEHIVFPADVMIVGESPGREEIQQGKPFIGRSGKILNLMLDRFLGLERKDVAIANAAKCMLPQDYKRSKKLIRQAIKPCREYLVNAIKQVKPKFIITLGEVALTQVLGKSVSIGTHRGNVIDSEEFGCKILPTYHPSVILRNGGIHGSNTYWIACKRDFLYFRDIIEGKLSSIEQEYREYRSNKPFRKSKFVAIDAEWDSEQRLLVFSISDGKTTAYVLPERLDMYMKYNLRRLLRKPIIFANRPADERILSKYLFFPGEEERRWIDIFNIAKLVNDNMHINLENIVEYALNERGIKAKAKAYKKFMEKMDKTELIKYNCRDAELTAKAFSVLIRELRKDAKLLNYWQFFTKPVEDMLANISLGGFKIDKQQFQLNKMTVEMEAARLEAELIDQIPSKIKIRHEGKLRLTRNELVADMIYSKQGLKLKPLKMTASGDRPAVDEETLKHYKDIEWVAKLLHWKKLMKLVSTYFGGIERNMDEEGYIYPSTVLYTTVTGRTSCFNPNLQQIPRSMPMSEKLKGLFAAPPGWDIGTRDLSQSELRIVAWLAREENMLRAIFNNEDLHTLTASLVMKKPIDKITKEERQAAKAINFGFIYGAQASTFQKTAYNDYGLSLTLKEAEKFRDAFFNAYPAIQLFHQRCIEIARKFKRIRSPLGRIRRLPHIDSNDYGNASRAERQAINFPVQSFSSDLALIGMYLFWKEIRHKKTIRLLWFIHDSIFFMCREVLIDKYMSLLKECMEKRAVEYIKKHFKVEVGYPVATDGKVGTSWATLKDYEE